jgi:hypothetical protein
MADGGGGGIFRTRPRTITTTEARIAALGAAGLAAGGAVNGTRYISELGVVRTLVFVGQTPQLLVGAAPGGLVPGPATIGTSSGTFTVQSASTLNLIAGNPTPAAGSGVVGGLVAIFPGGGADALGATPATHGGDFTANANNGGAAGAGAGAAGRGGGASLLAGNGGAGTATGAAGAGGSVVITAGNAGANGGAGGANGGSVAIDAGAASGAGAAGSILVGTTSNAPITLGNGLLTLGAAGLAQYNMTTPTGVLGLNGGASPNVQFSVGDGAPGAGATPGGITGAMFFSGGTGGAGTAAAAGGNGGSIRFSAAFGGAGTATSAAGRGGSWFLAAGNAGAANGGPGGNAGLVSIDAGIASGAGVAQGIFIGTGSFAIGMVGAPITMGAAGGVITNNSDSLFVGKIRQAVTNNAVAGAAATVNALRGSVLMSNAGAVFTLTNNQILGTDSHVVWAVDTADANATTIKSSTVTAGQAVLTLSAAPSANIKIRFWVINP